MSKEGLPTIIGLLVFSVLAGGFGYYFTQTNLLILSGICFLLFIFSLYFFRDPIRTIPSENNIVVAPADGKVIAIEEVIEGQYIQGKAKKVAIFLSLLNVHVNYVPYQGIVDFLRYSRGKFLKANNPQASSDNASIVTGIDTDIGKVVFKQSTGFVARRIVNHLKIGDQVTTGQKFGIIKFGSRMEIFLPLDVGIKVKLGDKVRAAETILAMINDKK